MSCEQVQIQCLENKQPIFKEFCKIHSLKNGDFYKPKDYIAFADKLSFLEISKIIQKVNE